MGIFVSVEMTVMLFIPVVIAFFLKKKNSLSVEVVCILLILMGVIIRMMYITYTSLDVRQHDVHLFFSGQEGHSEYIEYLYNNMRLPDFDPRDKWQFYHPPLHHIIFVLWLKFLNLFGLKIESGINTLQYLTVIYSTLFSVFAFRTFAKIGLKEKGLITATALVAFHPTLIILSGSINNDMLSSLFAAMAIFYTVKWSQDKKFSDIVKIAFCIGLGMFTKLSVGLLAPAVAIVFLMVFIKNIKEWKKYVAQFALFGIICCPLGLYWSVRNYVRFGVPLNYVPKLSENTFQYIDKSPLSRLTDWSLYQFASPFTQWGESRGTYAEFNPFIALLKNSMFDEGTFFGESITLQAFCVGLFLVNIVIVAFSLVAMVTAIIKSKNLSIEVKTLFGLIFAVIFGNYVNFCIQYPHICTQNTRYCVPLIMTGAAFVGLFINEAEKTGNKYHKGSVAVLSKCCGAFCALSTIVYTAMLYEYCMNDL